MSEPVTAVVFRKFREDGSIIALFPLIEHSHGLCESYMHFGQHSGANYYGLTRPPLDSWRAPTVPASPDEYAPLLRELTGLGYKLKVYKRRPAR